MAKPALAGMDADIARMIEQLAENKKAIPAIIDAGTFVHQRAAALELCAKQNRELIEQLRSAGVLIDEDGARVIALIADKNAELELTVNRFEEDVAGVARTIETARAEFAVQMEGATQEFEVRKKEIVDESDAIEAEVARILAWQRQSDADKQRLQEIRATLHRNRIQAAEALAQVRQSTQARIERHRVALAEAIKKTRADLLRLKDGDISLLTAQYQNMCSARLESLQTLAASGGALGGVNASVQAQIEEIEASRAQKRDELIRDRERVAMQVELMRKLRAMIDDREARVRTASRRPSTRGVELPPLRPASAPHVPAGDGGLSEAGMSTDSSVSRDLTLSVLNEAATTVLTILGEPGDARLDAKIERLAQFSDTLKIPRGAKPTLTPAAAYFAYSAPFDVDGIESERWSFARYREEPKQPRGPVLVRIRRSA